MRSSLALSLLLAPLALVAARPSNLLRRDTPIQPTEDPFYTPPDGFEDEVPGAILRSRPVPGKLAAFQSIPINLKGAWQFLYRTTDSTNNPIATVTTILVPQNADYKKLISYQVAEDAAYLNCAPSYTIQTGSNTTDAGTSDIESLLITAALNQGWIVSTPDWEGPNSTFIAGVGAGQATLDNVRATLQTGQTTGISPEAQYQMWGYSGGALASEWAAELQDSYAPELNFAGMAIGGTTPDIVSAFNTINKGPFAGLSAAGLLSFGIAYPEFNAALNRHLNDTSREKLQSSIENCFYADVKEFAGQDIYSYFNDTTAIFDDQTILHYFDIGANMGKAGTPKMPMLVYKSTHDEISPIADTDALVDLFCNAGVSITYIRDSVGEHFTQAATSAGDVVQFLTDRFNGEVQSGCIIRNETGDLLDHPLLLGVNLLEILANIVGNDAGPDFGLGFGG